MEKSSYICGRSNKYRTKTTLYMEVKKSPKADLQRSIPLSLAIGLVIALGVLYTGLEWKSAKDNGQDTESSLNVADMEDALFVPDQQEQQPEPEPEAPQEVVEVALPEEFKVVDDNKEVAKISIVSVDQDRELPPPPVIVQPTKQVVEEEAEEQIFEIVEEQPVPHTGGVPELLKWIAKQIEYPQSALDNNIQGQVVVRFVVEKDGSIGQVDVVKKVDPAIDKEAVRVVKSMPKWKPGKQRGKTVRSRYTLPIKFQLG